MTTQTTSLERLKHLLPQLFTVTSAEGTPFLRAQLSQEMTIALPMHCVEEVSLISNDMITPMPNMPDSVLGLVQAKGHIFWLVDLAKIIGLRTQPDRSKRHEMIMVNTQKLSPEIHISNPNSMAPDLFLGFSVQRVKGTIRLQPEDLTRLEEDSVSLSNTCLERTIVKNGELISILNF